MHEFEGSIFGSPANIRITSVTGHIFTRDFEAQYADWYKTDPETLFDVTTIKREVSYFQVLFAHLPSFNIFSNVTGKP